MLISHSHKLLFIHIQKTGGNSISRVLSRNTPDVAPLLAKHEFARRAMCELGPAWDEYFKFAFVRNPWDRLVSWYSMIRDAEKVRWHETLFDRTKRRRRRFRAKNRLWRYVYRNSASFDEFIRNCTGRVEMWKGVFYSFAYNQLDYITDGEGKVIVDFVGRFENFGDDLREVAGRCGIEIDTPPHENRSAHRHYSSYYTPETEMIVRERFKRDIEYFGYEFERRA